MILQLNMFGSMLNTAPEVQVACAIVWRNGKILLSKRHQFVHQGGFWEFPGGKCKVEEHPETALIRELIEELAIIVQSTSYICQIPWDYGDQRIRLWVYEVFEFEQDPVGREGQQIRWFDPKHLQGLQFPKANDVILRSIGLSRIARFYDPDFMIEPIVWALQFNQKSLLYFRGLPPGPDLQATIEQSLEFGHQIVLTVDQLSCYQNGCGVHLRKSDCLAGALGHLDSLRSPWPITSGVRDMHDFERQSKWPSDAIFISPVRETKSHPSSSALGFRRFGELASKTGVPVYALGGIVPQDLEQINNCYGFGVAGIRGFQ